MNETEIWWERNTALVLCAGFFCFGAAAMAIVWSLLCTCSPVIKLVIE